MTHFKITILMLKINFNSSLKFKLKTIVAYVSNTLILLSWDLNPCFSDSEQILKTLISIFNFMLHFCTSLAYSEHKTNNQTPISQ